MFRRSCYSGRQCVRSGPQPSSRLPGPAFPAGHATPASGLANILAGRLLPPQRAPLGPPDSSAASASPCQRCPFGVMYPSSDDDLFHTPAEHRLDRLRADEVIRPLPAGQVHHPPSLPPASRPTAASAPTTPPSVPPNALEVQLVPGGQASRLFLCDHFALAPKRERAHLIRYGLRHTRTRITSRHVPRAHLPLE